MNCFRGALAGGTLAVLAGLFTSPVWAADLAGEPQAPVVAYVEPARWEAAMAVYVWGAGIEGSVGLLGLPTVDVDISFSDVLGVLDFTVMAVGEARYERFGIFGDLVYVKVSGATATPRGLIADRVAFGQAVTIGTFAGTYDLSRWERLTLQAMAGVRIWSVDASLEISGGLIPVGSLSREQRQTWADPMLGLKARYDVDERWFLTGWGMAGGFGAGSEFGWDLFGGVGYEITDRFSLAGGYRGVGVDYSKDSFVWDITMHGPVVGGVYRF
jgi:opacity protein-like surface antigen